MYDDHFAGVAVNSFLDHELFMDSSRCFALNSYNEYLKKENATLFIDKTPRYYHILDKIEELFPKAKKIWLKRNPLDIAASFHSTWEIKVDMMTGKSLDPASFDLLFGLPLLADYFEKKSALKYEVKYEDIVASPAQTITDLCTFIGIPFREKMLHFGDNVALMSQHKNSALGDKQIFNTNTVQKGSVARWKKTFSSNEIETLLAAIGTEIFGHVGYPDIQKELEKNLNHQVSEKDTARAREALLKDFNALNDNHLLTEKIRSITEKRNRAEIDRAARLKVINKLAERISTMDLKIEDLQQYDIRSYGKKMLLSYLVNRYVTKKIRQVFKIKPDRP